MEQKITKIDITWRALFKIFAFLIFAVSLFLFKQIILWIFLALVISFLFNPIIDAIERKKVSRAVAALIVYGVFIAVVIWTIVSIFPPLISEITNLSSNFSFYFDRFNVFLESNGFMISDFKNIIDLFKEQLFSIAENAIAFAGSIMGQLFAFVTIFTLAIFLSVEKDFPVNFAKIFTIKEETEKRVLSSFEESKRQVVGYFNAKIVASIFVVIATLIFLSIIHVKYALSLSLISGICNIIPIIGPIISCVLIMFFAVFDSWVKALIVLIFCIIIQQIESNLLVPILTKKIIGIPTVLVLVSVLIGAKLGGVFGAIFIIPIAGIIYEFIQQYFKDKKEKVRKVIE